MDYGDNQVHDRTDDRFGASGSAGDAFQYDKARRLTVFDSTVIDRILMLEQADVLDEDNDTNTSEPTRSYYHTNALGSVMMISTASEAEAASYRSYTLYEPVDRYGKTRVLNGVRGPHRVELLSYRPNRDVKTGIDRSVCALRVDATLEMTQGTVVRRDGTPLTNGERKKRHGVKSSDTLTLQPTSGHPAYPVMWDWDSDYSFEDGWMSTNWRVSHEWDHCKPKKEPGDWRNGCTSATAQGRWEKVKKKGDPVVTEPGTSPPVDNR